MIKNFKIFENINQGEPEVGDYIIVYEQFEDELNSNIGELIKIFSKNTDDYKNSDYDVRYDYPYIVKFDNLSKKLQSDKGLWNTDFPSHTRIYSRKEIKYWSKDKEDLQKILDAQKFGLY